MLALAAVAGGLVAYAIAFRVMGRRWVVVELDGSGRWAVLSNVHPLFVAAVWERYRGAVPDESSSADQPNVISTEGSPASS